MAESNSKFDVIVFGAGPAGLAAALKLSEAGKKVAIFDKDNQIGGISKTIGYKGFLFDLGPHRFYTKSDEVNRLWKEILADDFLPVNRLTRIYYKNKFFFYPLKPANAFFGLGFFGSLHIIASYIWIRLFPYKEEKNYEQWVTNRFGKKLYRTFFKTYNEKLWGIPCTEMEASWVAQRIKGLSMTSAVKNALFPSKSGGVKTLIDQFHYPKYGSGMMYEKIAEKAKNNGADIFLETEVTKINSHENKIRSITVKNKNGEETEFFADHFLSSIPLTHLVKRVSPSADSETLSATEKLKFRSTIMVNLIYNSKNPFPDNWIYVHSAEAKTGRIGSPKNMSPFTSPDENQTPLSLEYWCNENDGTWKMSDEELLKQGIQDLDVLNLAKKKDFIDGFVVRIPKTYPVQDGTEIKNIEIIRNYLDKIENLQPIGRYGMFKYNNMDHSILTGLYAAENILGKTHDIWEVNADEEYQEEKKR
ncbi:MAG: NAD(P)/FAD-dependent oxidoreductase [Candidatus Moranbacteria bacterium]|nr:NAD(P)/FAD-dependent oxidoreductase [Candidatus Moranbacteria bacterium]